MNKNLSESHFRESHVGHAQTTSFTHTKKEGKKLKVGNFEPNVPFL